MDADPEILPPMNLSTFRDSPLLRSRKRISDINTAAAAAAGRGGGGGGGMAIPLSPLPIEQNHDFITDRVSSKFFPFIDNDDCSVVFFQMFFIQ